MGIVLGCVARWMRVALLKCLKFHFLSGIGFYALKWLSGTFYRERGGGASYIILPSASRFEAWIRVGYLHIPSQWVTIASCRREIQNSGAHCPMLMTPVMFPKPIPSPPNPCHAVTLTVLRYRHHTVAFVQSAGKIYDSEPCDIGMDLPLSSNVRVSSLNVNCIQDGGGTRWRHKPEGCGFDSRWCHWKFSLT